MVSTLHHTGTLMQSAGRVVTMPWLKSFNNPDLSLFRNIRIEPVTSHWNSNIFCQVVLTSYCLNLLQIPRSQQKGRSSFSFLSFPSTTGTTMMRSHIGKDPSYSTTIYFNMLENCSH